MKLSLSKILSVVLLFALVLTTSGVYAIWRYCYPAEDTNKDISLNVNAFSYEPPEVVYITNVEMVAQGDPLVDLSYDFEFPTDLQFQVFNWSSGSSMTFKVTVYNNTDVTYWYVGPKISADYGNNNLFGASGGISIVTKDKQSDTSATFNTQDWIPPRTSRDFYVTYSFGANATRDISTLVTYEFHIKMDAVYDGFLAVLNDKVSSYGYYYLADVFDKQYAEDGSTVIANVGDDNAIFKNLFGEEQLTIDVNGVQTPVTVMVERKDVDGRTATGDNYSGGTPKGCEYTVYITVDPLNSPTGQAIVYAVSYSCKTSGADAGTWYQIGQMYEGTADIVDYDTSNNVYEGAFDVDSWIATPNIYEVGDNITYKVGYEQGTTYDKLKTIEEIISAEDQEIYNKIDNSRLLKKAYDVLKANQYSDLPEVVNLRTAFENAAPYYNNLNNGQEFKIKRDYPRAELIPYILHIQQALDYYYQVHG